MGQTLGSDRQVVLVSLTAPHTSRTSPRSLYSPRPGRLVSDTRPDATTVDKMFLEMDHHDTRRGRAYAHPPIKRARGVDRPRSPESVQNATQYHSPPYPSQANPLRSLHTQLSIMDLTRGPALLALARRPSRIATGGRGPLPIGAATIVRNPENSGEIRSQIFGKTYTS